MMRIATVLAWVLLALAAGNASAQTPAVQVPAAGMLVLPFENAGSDPHLQWLGEAAALLVADGLEARGVPAVSRDERVRAFEALHLPLAASLSRATVIKVAQLLGATELVTGTYRVTDRQLTVQAHVIRVDAGRVRPPVSEAGPLTELFAIHDRLIRQLAPGSTTDRPAGSRPPLGAFENYVKGLLAESPAAKATFLESALHDAGNFEEARLALWAVRTEQADHAAALAAARGVAADSPLAGRARFHAATSLVNLQRYDEAFDAFSTLASAASGGVPAGGAFRGAVNNNLGVIQIRRGGSPQAGTAVYFLTRATEADPADANYAFNLGYGYVLERNYQAAVYWLREVLRREPADADAHFVLAAALQGGGSTVEAGRERDLARQLSARYEELSRSGGDRQGVPRGLERVQHDPDGSGTLRAGVIVGTSAQRDHRELASFHLERGRRLFDREQYGEALTELRRAVYLSPYESQAHLLIGRIHLRAGRPADAIDALKISIWSADGAPARLALAEAYLKIGNERGARTEAERALVLDPASAEAKRLLAQIR